MSERQFDPVQFTKMAREGWNAVALGWKKWAPTIEQGAQIINDRLVDMAALRPGQKVLDIAAGYGEPLVTAARRVGPSGLVVATDLSPEMIALARERTSELGLQNVEFYACNGETLDIPQSDFDAALCRWGLMLMPDPDACLRRVYKLLKSSGWVAMAVFSDPARSPFVAVAASTVRREVGLGPPAPDEPGIFRLADAKDLQRRFQKAGLRNVTIEQVGGQLEFDSPEAYVRFIQDVARDIVRFLEDQPSTRQEEIWQAVAGAARHYETSDRTVRFGFECHCVAGRK
ncbi:MAG: class I SAM-dependent methyltransferase [Thermoanaerobaculia bacterium]